MIILRIVMTNRGASVTDAFKNKSLLWFYSLKDVTERLQCTNVNFELTDLAAAAAA